MHVDIATNAEYDLARLWDEDPAAAAQIIAALEQIEADPNAIDKMTSRGDIELGATVLNVKRWERMQRQGNLWRFRTIDTIADRYRVVYGYHWQTRQICVLAVVRRRDFDYDDIESDISRRILGDWRAL